MTSELGELKQTFRPKMANIIAGSILGIGLIVGGVLLANYFDNQHNSNPRETVDYILKYASFAILGVGGPIAGIAMLFRMKYLLSHQIAVHDLGFAYTGFGKTEICKWTELEKVFEIFTAEQLKVLKIPGAALKNIDRSFSLLRDDGETFDVDVNSINSISKFGELLEEARSAHGIPWEKIHR